MATATEVIIAMLSEFGFTPDGATESIVVPTFGTHRCGRGYIGGRVVAGRKRFKNGERRATVGQRTTCLYRVVSGQCVDYHNFKTKDAESIRVTLGGVYR